MNPNIETEGLLLMKKETGILSLVLFILILIFNLAIIEPLPYTDNPIDIISFKLSQMVTHEPIEINGNEDFVSQAIAEGWPGNGTENNPYIISGLNISGESPVSLNITQVDCFFSINNSFMKEIHFTDVLNGKIRQNNVNDLYLNNISYCEITDNEFLGRFRLETSSNNIFRDNFLEEPWPGSEIHFSNYNNFINNTFIYTESTGDWYSPALRCEHSAYNNYTNNTFKDAEDGIMLSSSQNNTITHNICLDSGGIMLMNATNTRIIDNVLSHIKITDSSINNIINDNVLNRGIFIDEENIESC